MKNIETMQVEKEVTKIDSNIDKIEKYLASKEGTLARDAFSECDGTETVYITFTNINHEVSICIIKDGDKAEYGLHIAYMEDILEAGDNDEEYVFDYKWYKCSGRLINQLKEANL